jgi:hypothetical protein
LKRDEAADRPPLIAPQIGAKTPQRVHPARLSDYQIVVGFFCFATLLTLAILRLGQQAPFYIQDIRWEPLRRFCRVSFTVKNPKGHSISSQALIQFFGSSNASNVYINNVPAGSVKVPIRLAGNESRMVTSDFVYSEKTSNCQFVEIKALDLTNGG